MFLCFDRSTLSALLSFMRQDALLVQFVQEGLAARPERRGDEMQITTEIIVFGFRVAQRKL